MPGDLRSCRCCAVPPAATHAASQPLVPHSCRRLWLLTTSPRRRRFLALAAAAAATTAAAPGGRGFTRPFYAAPAASLAGATGAAGATRAAAVAAAAAAAGGRGKPTLDYPPPPPAASVAWPRYLSWLAVSIAAAQGTRRKLFGGSEAVALDPSLPMSVRLELIKSRRSLRSKASGVPQSFRRMLREAADTLEEVPALLVTVAVLAGDMLRRDRSPLKPFRELGEAQALLFTAGCLHLGMNKGGSANMRLLGGDFLYAEGQWMLAELGSLPTIRLISRMIRDISDGCSEGGAAAGEHRSGRTSDVGYEDALHAAFLRTGTYFASVASGAAWMAGAPPSTVDALRRYGASLGCALRLAQFRQDPASQDIALWLARSAREALQGLGEGSAAAAVRGMSRLAHRVERSCAASLAKLIRDEGEITGLSYSEFERLQKSLDALYHTPDLEEGEKATALSGLGFTRDEAGEKELQELILLGLSSEPIPEGAAVPAMEWPEGGPKKALEGCMRCIGREVVTVNKMLDKTVFAESAESPLVKAAVVRLFQSGGKRLRPALALLVARAVGAEEASLERVVKLAISIEVLHSASLVHDDILDGADRRRGEETTHVRHGDRAATLVGDFLFGQASCLVAELGSMPAVLLISKVVADFGRGELAQTAVRFEAIDYSLEDYLAKSFYKTASLLAAACQAAAVLSGVPPNSREAQACYRFGAFVGLAFQVVDDVLDFTSTEEELGKPALADLKEGNLGAPVLFAAQQDADLTTKLGPEAHRELLELLERRLSLDGDLDRVRSLVEEAQGVVRAKALARRFIDLAAVELSSLPESEARDGLRTFAEYVIARTF